VFTMTLSGRQHAVYWADERSICIIGEQCIRDAIESGGDVVLEIEGGDVDDAERVRHYLQDVLDDARAVLAAGA
jgi:hypothetical protein